MNGTIPNIAELALETRHAAREADLAQICFALQLEAFAASDTRSKAFELATRIGLSHDATGAVLDQWEYRARMLHAACVRLEEQIPFEAQIRAMMDAKKAA